MKILGQDYSHKIEELHARLKDFSGSNTVFDNLIEEDSVFGTPGGTYHSSEDTPRISLPPDVSEETVAHELLHGVLCYQGYPGWHNGLRERFAYACDTAHEVCHCCIHIVIDQHLEELGYNAVAVKSATAKKLIKAILKKRESVSDESGRHWWAIRASCELVRGTQNIIAGRIPSSGGIYVQTGQSGSAKATG